jgi:hypothetical protein
MTKRQRQLCDELAARLRQLLPALRGVVDRRLRRVRDAAVARRVEGVECDILTATEYLSVIVCGWGELGLRASQSMILDDEGLPDADSVPWDSYAEAGLNTWRVVAEELATFLIDRWKQLAPGPIPMTVTYDGIDLDL